MKIKDKFKEIVNHQGITFVEWFGDMEYEDKVSELYSKGLEKSMLDDEILSELKPTELTLGEVFNYLKNKVDKSSRMIFYCRDKDSVLRAVGMCWGGGGWRVYAYSVGHPNWWPGGRQVFSRLPFDSVTESLPKKLVINGFIYERLN